MSYQHNNQLLLKYVLIIYEHDMDRPKESFTEQRG